jgi:hypothetical protein
MALNDTPSRRGPALLAALDDVLHALFPEARRRERRRRLGYLALLLILGGVVIGLLEGGIPGRDAGAARVGDGRATVASIALPHADRFSSLEVVGARLLLLGGSPPASGWITSLVQGRVDGSCDAAVVDPRTLAIGVVTRANCGDPALYGQPVLPVAYWSSRAGQIEVRIARSDLAARDGYTLSPVLTTYQYCSDCQASWIYGDGSLWIYNPAPSGPRGQAVLLRISARTGSVIQRWPMPTIVRALLAVDADGLWLTPSVESGGPPLRSSPDERAAHNSLYRIAPGARAPQRVLDEGDVDARWLVAAGDTASAAVDDGRGYSRVWTFTGGSRPVRGPTLSDWPMGTEYGTGTPSVAGSARIGYFNVVFNSGDESVIEVTPGGRGERKIGNVRSAGSSDAYLGADGATLDGSYFYIDPTAHDLRRITPPR